jgi:tRNA U34 5-methylaminomethyl-2-thiouridine-forming methyltransferase MnmC
MKVPCVPVPAKQLSESFTLVTVASGARSLHSDLYDETFHPVVGPMEEARGLHVGQSRLLERARAGQPPIVVWDVGLGAAANAIATLEAWRGISDPLELHSFDLTLEALVFARTHAEELAYPVPWVSQIEALCANGTVDVGHVRWTVHLGDFREVVRKPPAPAPHAIFYDPYSPAANPGMWTLEHFRRLRAALDPARPCTLTSYSRSTAVRVTLALAGFYPGQGSSTGEKDQTTLAATHRHLLAQPLGARWLERVRRSTRGGPLRDGAPGGPISAEDLATLERMLHEY